MLTKNIFAVWWDPINDYSVEAERLADTLISIRDDCLINLGMRDPPNPGKGFYYNVYIYVDNDLFPSEWGAGQGTDTFGVPFLALGFDAIFSSTAWHEAFHIFQYETTSPGDSK